MKRRVKNIATKLIPYEIVAKYIYFAKDEEHAWKQFKDDSVVDYGIDWDINIVPETKETKYIYEICKEQEKELGEDNE